MRPLTMKRRALMAAMGGSVDVATMAVSYTGEYTDEIKTMSDGKAYRLLTLIKSGVLTLKTEVKADIWICGGGSNATDSGGGAGAYAADLFAVTIKTITAAIGSNNGVTTISGNQTLTVNAVQNTYNGGTGGGRQDTYNVSAGRGDGKSKIPFGDSNIFPAHAAGGAGGGVRMYDNGSAYRADGSNGGTNGGNSGFQTSKSTNTLKGGIGGERGGGNGGNLNIQTPTAGSNGSYYGSGGGNGGLYRWIDDEDEEDETSRGKHGSGYQGVCYIRIPLDQAV